MKEVFSAWVACVFGCHHFLSSHWRYGWFTIYASQNLTNSVTFGYIKKKRL